MHIIFLGPPGVGKGTYAKLISKQYKLPTISAGKLLRNEIKAKKVSGIVEKIVDAGDLAPHKIVDSIVRKQISRPSCKKGFILDGYPRTVEQAKLLDKKIKFDAVINFKAPKKILVERLRKRGRDDDTPTAIKERFLIHKKQVIPVIHYYKKKGILYEVDASSDLKHINKILNPIKKIISAIK